jgi:hypothetical protein
LTAVPAPQAPTPKGTPQRLSLESLAALYDILGCGPGDLIRAHKVLADGNVSAVKEKAFALLSA